MSSSPPPSEKTLTSIQGMLATDPVVRSQSQVIPNRDLEKVLNASAHVTTRGEFGRNDFDSHRPCGALAKSELGIIQECLDYQDEIGVYDNALSTMAEFVCEGIMPVAASKKQERFYQEWFQAVDFANVAESMARALLGAGTAIPLRSEGMLPPSTYLGKMQGGVKIPTRYLVLDPTCVTLANESVAHLLGTQGYRLKLQMGSLGSQLGSITPEEKRLLPLAVQTALVSNQKQSAELPKDSYDIYCYKKQPKKFWGRPIATSIREDFRLYRQAKLADASALDGVISKIRLWKLGAPDGTLDATPEEFTRLAEMLAVNVSGGVMDLIWNWRIALQETQTDSFEFLGDKKYAPILAAIYAALGIPPTLTGSGGNGATNNYVSLKTLLRRLIYVRGIVSRFAHKEFGLVQKAMGYRKAAFLTYTNSDLADEASEKALYIQLVDRGLISDHTIQQRFGELPEVEAFRLKREKALRDAGDLPIKLGPFSQQPVPTDSEGSDKEEGVQPGGTGGRPRNTPDKTKRKTKVFKPKMKAFRQAYEAGLELGLVPGEAGVVAASLAYAFEGGELSECIATDVPENFRQPLAQSNEYTEARRVFAGWLRHTCVATGVAVG